jgi:uroporphyrinogen-III synthase
VILNTRPLNQSKPTTELFLQAGYDVVESPLLEVEFLPIEFFLSPEVTYIVTSTNAFLALKNIHIAKDLKFITLTEASKDGAKNLGFKNISFFNNVFTAQDLAKAILDQADRAHEHFAHLRGKDVSLDIGEYLNSQGFNAQSHIVYETKLVKAWTVEIIEFFNRGKIHAITFYSQKTASSFLSLAEKYNLEKFLSSIYALCLSEKIEKSIEGLPWQGIITASTTLEIIAKFK